MTATEKRQRRERRKNRSGWKLQLKTQPRKKV